MVSRRGFLGMMAGALAAPAIVRAESLMKIVVPKQEIILPPAVIWAQAQSDIQAELVKMIRDTAYRMYVQSGYTHVNDGPLMPSAMIISDPKILRYFNGNPT